MTSAPTSARSCIWIFGHRGAALLYYEEPDRVTAVEPVISAKYHIDTDETVALKIALDSLTGASGSGAVPSDQPANVYPAIG